MQIKKPTLILDKKRSIKNIERIVKKIEKSNVRFRPHFKTHQSAHIGEWFKSYGVKSISVSSVEMASYFAKQGWKDITITFLMNKLEIDEINTLSESVDLNLVVESEEAVLFLSRELMYGVKLWIKIDTGYGRTGIENKKIDKIISVSREIEKSDKLKLKGILSHSGHSYNAKSINGLKKIYNDTIVKMNEVRDRLQESGFFNLEISIGDTPTCSVVETFYGVDEIRCGNFIFYDIKQFFIGSCKENNIALALACPVVSKQIERNEIVVYGGAVHLSKDCIEDSEGRKIYGLVSNLKKSSFGPILKQTYVSSVSQEHGIIRSNNPILEQLKVGEILLIFPVHSCLAANLMGQYLTLDGEIINTLNS